MAVYLLGYRDDDLNLREFEGTCMRGHAGTDWLETSFPLEEVPRGEKEIMSERPKRTGSVPGPRAPAPG